ncbi:hypothetical protein [Microbacterium immunditiarum]|uniref:TrbL/VirB6 plasmid conjugal transfer protein n=1 Tax=Microbacterium immunditiarum TaxID=337480 RepID=A0A7Y9GK96_9MICO|nr:hypothetical protein [Microbacterium immunditiarum]NYE18012.1 hypothetical protein [Microbacterium immunditiarum]
MSKIRMLVTGVLVGLCLAGAAVTPALAAEPVSVVSSVPLRTAANTATPIAGEVWSAPAYPVDCYQVERQVTCTPQNASDIEAQQCFTKVLIDGAGTTLCTTYEEHVEAVKAAGGRPLIVQYGCQLGDLVCASFENAGRGMALGATAVMYAVAETMRFDTSSLLWTAALGEWSFWQWAILIVTFGAMVWAIAAAVVSGDRAELVGALIRSFIVIPAVPLTLWATGHLLNAVDDMTWYLLSRDGATGLFSTLQSVMWAGGQANYFFAFLIHGLLMLAMLLLMLVFAFRNIVLAALIAVGPIGWMLYPVRTVGPQWVVRYVSAVVVLLLTGPLTIGFLTLVINGLAGVNTIWDPRSWPLVVGLVLIAFAPVAVFGLFNFVGGVAADGLGSRMGSGASRTASNAARTVARVPSRIAALPAGVPSGGGKASAAAVSSSSRTKANGPARGPSAPAGKPRTTDSTPSPASTPSTTAPPTPKTAEPTRTERAAS